MKTLPKTLYVLREGEGTDDEFLHANGDYTVHAIVNESVKVGVYVLQEYAFVRAGVVIAPIKK